MLYRNLVHKVKKNIERKKQLKNVALVGIGAVIGSVAAALTTPKKGEDLRKDIKNNYIDAVDNVKKKTEEVKTQIKDTMDEGKVVVEDSKDTKEDLYKTIKDVKSDLK